jgi:hypothetical protein
MTPLDVALDYIRRGWNPVPLPFRSKGGSALGKGWQHRVITTTTAVDHFNGGPQNIGVVLGPTSHGLTDVDLDCMEAIGVAPYFLPKTKAIFGRQSKRNSHYLYETKLGSTSDTAAIVFDDPNRKPNGRKDSQRLLELRIGGEKGAQTVFPGSTHEEGEDIRWEESGDPANVDGAELSKTIRHIAAWTLLVRYWPAADSHTRHTAAFVLGGFLARAGFPKDRISYIVEVIAKVAKDEERLDRRRAAEDAASADGNAVSPECVRPSARRPPTR